MTSRSAAGRDRLMTVGLVLAISLLGVALRLYELDADSLWNDEIVTATRNQHDLTYLVTYSERQTHPPLGDLVTKFFITLSGDSEFVLRLQAMVFGSLSILLIYKAGEILWTSEAGLVGALLLAVSPYHVRYSQEANPYALMVFLSLGSLIFLAKALQTRKKRLWLGFVLCTSLSLYNHHFAFLLLPALVVFAAGEIAGDWLALGSKRERGERLGPALGLARAMRQGRPFLMSLALVGLLYLPWLPSLLRDTAKYTQPDQIAYMTQTGSLQSSLSFLHSAVTEFTGAFLLLWLGAFALGLAASDSRRIALVSVWMGAPFVFLALVQANRFFAPRYVLFMLPLYLLVIGNGVIALGRWVQQSLRRLGLDRQRLALLASALGVLIFGGLSVPPLRDYYVSQKEDWRGAARFLTDNMAEGDVVLIDSQQYRWRDAGWASFCLSYYLRPPGSADPQVFPVTRRLGEDLENVKRDQGETWTVLWYELRPRSWNKIEEISVASFQDITVIRLRQPSGDPTQDAVSMLGVLLELLPDKPQFDVRLALADVYLRTEAYDQARLELEVASQIMPGDPQASQDLGDSFADLERLSHLGDAEIIQHPLWRSFGDVVALVGYTVHPTSVRSGDPLHVALHWQALAQMDKDYSVFVHVVGPDGRVWAQADTLLRQLGSGGQTTSHWQVAETTREEYVLVLAPDAPSGEYVVMTGLYYWETGERLPARDEGGQRESEDSILLETVTVID